MLITHISTMSRMQIPAQSHKDNQSRLPSGFHPSIATTRQDRQIINTKPASFARPARSVQASRQAGRQKLRSLQVTSPDMAHSKAISESSSTPRASKEDRQATLTVPDARYMLFPSRSHDDL
jgi:hypothetical protein